MIGQQKLITELYDIIDNNNFPRFSILCGSRGSGKRLLTSYIAKRLKVSNYIVLDDVKIDTIRDIITQAYKMTESTLYVIPEADNMSIAAKNAMLKVTEEPPNKIYFIMTLCDMNSMLDTIKSRAQVFQMDEYTPEEIAQYKTEHYGEADIDVFKNICTTPGEVDLLAKYTVKEFYDYVRLVVDNIAEVQLANAFKITSKVALKENDEGYDLSLFWKCFISICRRDIERYGKAILSTSYFLSQTRIKGINRSGLMDMWIMDMREKMK